MTGGPTSTSRDDATRLGKGAIALLALGAPFVATAPAAADGGGPGHRGDGQAEAQTSAHASGGAGGRHAASAATAPPSHQTATEADGDTSGDGTAASKPSAGAGSRAEGHGGKDHERTEGRRDNATGNAEVGESGEIVGAARGEGRESGEIIGPARGEARERGAVVVGNTRGPEAPTPIVEAPSVPLTAQPMPASGVMPGTEEALQAPREADRPMQPRGSASRPGAVQPTGSATGPAVTTGASAPSGVTRKASAAGLQRRLPFTGAEVPLTIIGGATLLAAGALLRRRVQGEAR
jgi:hypothetical protein